MKVLVTFPHSSMRGGVAGYGRILREYLPADVHYCTVGARSDTETPTGMKLAWRLAGDYLAIVWAMVRFRPKVLHVNPSFGPRALLRDALPILLMKLFRGRVLVFFHGWDPGYSSQLSPAMKRLLRTTWLRADAVIVLASPFAKEWREIGYTGPIHVETTAVENYLFEAGPSHALLRRQATEPFTILFLARLEQAKGVMDALECYALLKPRYPQLRMIMAGDGLARSDAIHWVAERHLADVTFPGYLRGDAKLAALASASCYLFPSHHNEGMPTSVLEAMAAGLPVITHPVGGLPDFFQDGIMGFIVADSTPARLAERLQTLIEDPERTREIAQQNQVYARKRFAASDIARRLQKIYRDLSA